jgi:hypothetical protein
MPLYPGGPRFGFGLWNSVAGTLVVEIATFAAGVWLYMRTTRPRDRIGRYGFRAYVGFLLVAYVGDRFGGPPPDVASLIWNGIIAEVVLLLWAWWFDAHRDVREPARTSPTLLSAGSPP